MDVAAAPSSLLGELDEVLTGRRLNSLYQPVADLDTHSVIGYEALARGPEGSALELPAHLLEAARRARRVGELDSLCRTAALAGALEAGLWAPRILFVNIEPNSLGKPVPDELRARWSGAARRPRVVLDVGEPALISSPTELLWSVEWARDLGWSIALDDVGGDSRSLAMLRLLQPEVIKVDLALLERRPKHEVATVIHSVAAEAERTGATILAEGIETEAQVDQARALGAQLGQGWLYGRPRPLPDSFAEPTTVVRLAIEPPTAPIAFTPFDMLRDQRPARPVTKRVLLSISRALERKAMDLDEPPVVLSVFQDERCLTPATRAVYARLASSGAFVAALGVGMSPSPAPGVRGIPLFARDPLRDQWVVVVLAPHFSVAFAARDLGDGGSSSERCYEYAATYQRELAAKIGRTLMAKIIAG